MTLWLFARRLSGKDDVQTASIRVGRLAENGDPRVLRNQCGERHAAKPRLVSLQDRRTAGERCAGDEKDQENACETPQASRLRAAGRRFWALFPHPSISPPRRRLFLLRS